MPLASPPSHAQQSYLPHVDGLRALAVALVVIFHAWPGLMTGGFIGVDVFFVISGFIITRQIFAEMETGSFSFVAFLGRRARRLIPAAAVCSLLVTVAALVILMPDALRIYGESLAAVWTMTANFYFYSHSGYFDAPAAQAPLLHMWSLAVEDQFYLTWPLLLLLFVRRLRTRALIIGATLLVAALSLAHSIHATDFDQSLAFYLPFSRAFELLAGAVLALAIPHGAVLARRTGALTLLELTGLALVAGSAFVLNEGTAFPGWAVVPTVIGSLLLIGPSLYAPTPIARLLSLRPVVLTGKMSYSIYLYHWPPLALATYYLGRAPNATEAAVLVAACLLLAALSWLLVEQKLTRALGLHDLDPAVLFKRTAAVALGFCLFAGVTAATHGLPQRLDTAAYEVYAAASSGNPRRASCDGYERVFRNDAYCNFGKPLAAGASYDIAVFGDSNADHFVPMIAALSEAAGYSGRQVTQSTCAALYGAARSQSRHSETTCVKYQKTIVEFLDRNPGLKIAVLSSAWSSYKSLRANKLADSRHTSFAHFAADTVALFRKRGIKVFIIGQVPFFDTFSLSCFVDAARRDTEEVDCAMPREAVDRSLAISQDAFETLAAADKDVTFLSMRDLLCTGALCSAFKDRVMLYRDPEHLNAVGSAYLARYASLPAVGAQ